MRSKGLTLVAVSLSIFISACSSPKSGSSGIPVFPPTQEGPAELPYCGTPISISGSTVTISGNARFEYRTHYAPGAIQKGLGPVENSQKPIRRAEVRVLNETGAVVQCTETDNNGDFSFLLPEGSSVYTIQVNSRSNNDYLKATVFDQTSSKQFYSVSQSVIPDQTKNIGNLIAYATGDIVAGAFNILDQLLNANIYLKNQVGSCPGDCPDFTTAPKVEVFWRKGFNPGSYYNSPNTLSFYLPGYSRIFILGGVNGNTDNADTDHFDNSVIIHEYGHFLEDAVFKSDSPGGNHNGDKVIDPRLAWSEGWGNFFQAAVQDQPYYIDTYGNSDGNTGYYFYINLEDRGISEKDIPEDGPSGALGEGNFREFSITRLLWDAVDTADDSESVINGFPELWQALTKPNAWTKETAAFRSIGWFHFLRSNLAGASDWSSLLTYEKQIPTRKEYANYVAPGACADYGFRIHPVYDGGTYATSDLFRNNDFFHFRAASSLSNVKFRLLYKKVNAAAAWADLDLVLYNESARFGHIPDQLAKSELNPQIGPSVQEESITISSLDAGNYLINVFVYTADGAGGSADYTLQFSSNNGQTWSNLCESTLP